MNDEETVALIAGGHTLGKAHGAANPGHICRSRARGSRASRSKASAGRTPHGKGNAEDTITSGLEGAWTYTNRHQVVSRLLHGEHVRIRMGAGPRARPARGSGSRRANAANDTATVPDAHDPALSPIAVFMLTTDLVAEARIRSTDRSPGGSYENPEEFKLAFAKAWYKLTHRDMGPYSQPLPGARRSPPNLSRGRILVPAVDHELVNDQDVAELKRRGPRLGSCRPTQLVSIGLGVGGHRSDRHRHAGRRERCPDPPCSRSGTGK